MVGDVGEAWDALDTALKQAVELQKNFEDARAAAVKAGAVTNDQLDQMGYKKTPKIPVLPPRPGEETGKAAPKTPATPAAADAGRTEPSNGATPAPQLASVGAPGGEDH